MKLSKKKIVYVILGIVILIAAGSSYYLSREKPTSVEVFKVTAQDIEETVLATGKIEAKTTETLSAQTSARVKEVKIKVGDHVTKGQILFILDKADILNRIQQEEANLAIQKASLENAKKPVSKEELAKAEIRAYKAEESYKITKEQFSSISTLYEQGAVAKEAYQDARLQLTSSEAELKTAQEDYRLLQSGDISDINILQAQLNKAVLSLESVKKELDNTVICAPFDGIILSLTAETGQYVSIGTNMANIGDMSGLQIKTDISEADIGLIKQNQPVRITSPAALDEEFLGTVTEIAPIAITQTDNNGQDTKVSVTVGISDGKNKLKPGFTVDLEINTASLKAAIAIPYEALMQKEDKKQVWVVNNNIIKLRNVETSIGNELYTSIVSGLNVGDTVIKSPSQNLKEGMTVKVLETGKAGTKKL